MTTEMWRGTDNGSVSKSLASVNSTSAEQLVLMCASALFKGLTQRECGEIASSARTRTFGRNELLYLQGQTARSLVLLQSGSVKHTQLSSGGNEVILRMSGSGDALHVQTESTSCNHTCSARAIEQSSALVWEYARLQALLVQYPQIQNNISRILAVRIQELEERFREVSTEKVAKRLALVLLRLVKRVGKPSSGGIQVSLSREELAQMTGTTLFTISRVLSRWAQQGFIVPLRNAVLVRDPKRLESVGDEEE
jgi:CRP-like cAMP-binding protein